jgi:DNA-binding transcriptional ArsR family regulator
VDKIFKALADINRRKILTLLKNSESNVSGIVEKLDIGQSTVSTHLSILRKANLVDVTVKSKERIYKLKREIFNGFVKQLDSFMGDELIIRRNS